MKKSAINLAKRFLVLSLTFVLAFTQSTAFATSQITIDPNTFKIAGLPARGQTDDPNDPNSAKAGEEKKPDPKDTDGDDIVDIVLPDRGERKPPVKIPGSGSGSGGSTGGSTGGSATTRPTTPTTGTPDDRQRIRGIKETSLPGLSCPLIDNRPHVDVLTAIENLNKVVNPAGTCAGNPKLAQIGALAKTLQTSYLAMSGFVGGTDPNLAVDPAAASMAYQKATEQMFQSLEGIGKQLESNELISSDCGKEIFKSGDILLAVSDLVVAATPFMFMSAFINPALLGYMLPVAAVAGIGKVIAEMKSRSDLQMSNPNHRYAVLQNTCEFWKINERVKYIRMAQSGQIDELTRQLSVNTSQPLAMLRNNASSKVLNILETRDTIIHVLRAFKSQLNQHKLELAKLYEGKKLDQDAEACGISRVLVNNIKDGLFPKAIIVNYQGLISKQLEVTLNQKYLITSEQEVRYRITLNKEPKTDTDYLACGRDGKRYLDILGQILADTEKTIYAQASSLRDLLDKEEDYLQFESQEQRLKEEQALVDKVVTILKSLSTDSASLTRFEINTQTRALKESLFGSQGERYMQWINGYSPVYGLLKFMNDQFNRDLRAFHDQFRGLVKTSFEATETGPVKIEYLMSDTIILQQWQLDLLKQRQIDLNIAAKLENINPQTQPVGSKQQKNICRRLSNAWWDWTTAIDSLTAIEFFCGHIEGMMDERVVEPEIIKLCYNKLGITDKVLSKSRITEAKDYITDQKEFMSKMNLRDKALLISKKMNDLKCETPSPAAMK